SGDENSIRSLLYSIEKHSSHPIAKALQKELSENHSNNMEWKKVYEDRGIGINAEDRDGNIYSAGSFNIVKHFYKDLSHYIYLMKNNELLATVDLEDELKGDVTDVVKSLQNCGMRVMMISGDRKEKCASV